MTNHNVVELDLYKQIKSGDLVNGLYKQIKEDDVVDTPIKLTAMEQIIFVGLQEGFGNVSNEGEFGVVKMEFDGIPTAVLVCRDKTTDKDELIPIAIFAIDDHVVKHLTLGGKAPYKKELGKDVPTPDKE